MSPEIPYPRPYIGDVSGPYWASAAVGQLMLQWCVRCETWVHTPRILCPECWGRELEPRQATGEGVIWSFTIVHGKAGAIPSYWGRLPYVVAVVELAEGPRVVANVVFEPGEQVHAAIGLRVRLSAEPRDDVTLPQFVLV